MKNFEPLTRFLRERFDKSALAGLSAAIAGPDGLLYTFNAGFIDAAHSRRPDPDTVFGVGSLSKSFTALSLALLHAEGRLHIDDPAARYVPGFRFPGMAPDAITLRHLCTHTSGLPPMELLEWSSAMNSPGRSDPETLALRAQSPGRFSSMEDLLDYIARCPYPPTGQPGETMSYSNEGYAVLSSAVDAAAGMPLEDFLQERVFAPLGLSRTILDSGIDATRRLAAGNLTSLFTRQDGSLICDDSWSVLPGYRGCAMIRSTARDLSRYYSVLASRGRFRGQALPGEAVELMIGADYPLQEAPFMCMGLYKRNYAGHVLCTHAGGLHGVSALGAFLPDEGIGFSVLCNQGGENVDGFLYPMIHFILDLPLDRSPEWFHPVPDSCPRMENLCGCYQAHEGLTTELTLAPGGRMSWNGSPLEVTYCGGGRFLARSSSGDTLHLEFLTRGSRAWGVRVGSRVHHLIPSPSTFS